MLVHTLCACGAQLLFHENIHIKYSCMSVNLNGSKFRVIQGNCKDVLVDLESNSVDCCVTSPPYWGLRDYGIDDQLGLEPNFADYISNLCDIFDEVKRVLKPSGTCWVVIGDTYAGGAGSSNNGFNERCGHASGDRKQENPKPKIRAKNLPSKCLCQIPSRFSIEMCNRGWILRNSLIWHKPNAMPSSVKDRFTVNWESVFFFVKEKKYYFEQQFEPFHPDTDVWYRKELREGKTYDCKKPYKGNTQYATAKAQNPSESKARILESMRTSEGRNKRCVWTIPTQPSSEPHFAMYPEKLIEPMIRAGCPEFVCKKCGQAREKIYKHGKVVSTGGGYELHKGNPNKLTGGKTKTTMVQREKICTGYTDCGCNAEFEGGVVLDPFSGMGTTGIVARKLGRKYIGIELNGEYAEKSESKIHRELGMFA